MSYSYTLNQPQHVSKLKILDDKSFKKEEFVAERVSGSCVSAVFCPESSFGFCAASKITAPEVKYVKYINKVIYYCMKDNDRGLKFVKLDMDSLAMDIFVDAGFAPNRDMPS